MVKNLTLENVLDIISEEIARLDKRIDDIIEKPIESKYLTSKQRQEICESKESVKSLALKFNRTRQQIYNIRRKYNETLYKL
jgi:response regulator RpfG family c-di-GMP phosphodiesterase